MLSGSALILGIGAPLGEPSVSALAEESSTPPPAVATITLQALEPRVARPGDTIELVGTLRNVSASTLHDVSVVARVSTQRITTRYDLAKDSQPSTIVGVLLGSTRQSFGDLPAGAAVQWHISIATDRLSLPRDPDLFGAYPLTVEAHSSDDIPGSSPGGIARLPTTLLWMPTDTHLVPTEVGWVIPLIGGVHRGANGVFFDDTLAGQLSIGKHLGDSGRLGALLTVTREAHVPLTLAIDPALVDDAAAMAAAASGSPAPTLTPSAPATAGQPTPKASSPTSSTATGPPSASTPTPSTTPTTVLAPTSSPSTEAPYLVRGPKGSPIPGTGATAAAGWLASLRDLLSRPGVEAFGLPYADADLTALEHAGLAEEIAIARSTGQTVLASDLGALSSSLLSSVAWPVDGFIDTATLADLSNDLVDTVLLSDQALPPVDPNRVGGIRADLQTPSGRVTALLADSTITGILAHPDGVIGGLRAAEQRVLAETMLITEQQPGVGSAILLTLPRFVDPRDGFISQLLADSASLPWLRPVTLTTLAATAEDDVPRAGLRYPASARAAELPASALSDIPEARDLLAVFNAILGPGTVVPEIDRANVAILRAESETLRPNPRLSSTILKGVLASIRSETAKVYIGNPGLITLTSRTQKIPITIVNDLPDPVTVRLRLEAVNPARLTVAPIPEITVAKNSRQDVLVQVTARTNGRFEVRAQLLTPDVYQRPYGQPVSFQLNATAYGVVALAIAAGAAGLLVLWSGIRLWKRRRLRART